MKVFALFALLAAGPVFAQDAAESSAPWVNVIWPSQGEDYSDLKRSFTLGNVKPGSTLTVNGAPMRVEDNGAFLDMVDLGRGDFKLFFAAEWGGMFASTTVVVRVGPPHGLPETGQEELAALEPSEDLEVRSGDLILVRCKGPPDREGFFRIDGLAGKLPLAESSGPVRGVYEGHYWVQPRDRGKDLKVRCALKGGLWGGPSAKAPGKVTALDPAQTRTAVTAAKTTVVKTISGGYTLFYPPGVRLEVVGRRGKLSRVRLSEHEDGWVDTDHVEFMPEGSPPPRGMVGRWVRTKAGADRVSVSILAPVKLPYEVRQTLDPLGFTIRFFGADQRFDRIVYHGDDPIVKEVRWRQESSRVVAVTVETRLKRGWGYHGGYDEEGSFVLDIRRPPDLTRANNVFAGRRIVVDPGHGPQMSAIGPLGTAERDLNLAVSRQLEELLLARGADVFMIRNSSAGPALVDRAFMAREAAGDLYISVHHNGFRKDWDPRSAPRGFTNFYYHPQSRPLVDAVHASYRARHPELADEHVRWGDLYVCRITDMPSILTESAYVVLPEHEKLLIQPSYQRKLARTMFEGIRAFYEGYRALQRESPGEQAAAGALD